MAGAHGLATPASGAGSSLTVALENGRPIPEPRAPSYGDADGYSGKLLIRLPKDLHRDLARAAEEQGVSINLVVATALARALGQPDPQARKSGRPPKHERVITEPGGQPAALDG